MFLAPIQFPFTKVMEANWKIIQNELHSLPKEAFMDFPEAHLYEKGWGVFSLYAFGQKLSRNCLLCPETTKLVETIPGLATASFSWLKAGTHIKPHVGYKDSVLRCHLGLIVPDQCMIRVGNETKSWEEGKCMVFDDTTEHEAWNHSNTDRVVLLIDFTEAGATYATPDFIASRIPDIMKATQRFRPKR